MSIVSEATGERAKISVLKTYSLKHANATVRKPASRRASTAQPSSRPKPPNFLSGTSGTPPQNNRPLLPVTPLVAPVAPQIDVVKFKTWAEVTIENQQKDIDRISGSVERMEKDLRLLGIYARNSHRSYF